MRRDLAVSFACVTFFLVLHLSCSKPDRHVKATSDLLNRMAGEIRMLMISEPVVLSGGVDQLIVQFNRQSAYDKERSTSYPGIESGHDAWGRPIVLDSGGDAEDHGRQP